MAGLPEQDIPAVESKPEPNTLGTIVVRDRPGNPNDVEILIESGHPLPDIRSVLVNMPPKVERYLKKEQRYGVPPLREAIRLTRSITTYQQWSDAIGSAILTRMSNKTGAVTDLKNIAEGGYLAIGETLFKLSPVALVKTNKALAVTRKRVLDKINIEVDLIKSSAKATSDALLENAVRKKLEADEYKAKIERTVSLTPPTFITSYGLPNKYSHGNWYVGFTCLITLSSFEFFYTGANGRDIKHVWKALPMKPMPIPMWVPVQNNGMFSATSVSVDESFPVLPHMDHYSGCLGLSGLPSVINGRASVRALKQAIEQCFAVVNLSSLYVSPDNWKDTFKEAIPLALFSALTRSEWVNRLKTLAMAEGIQEEYNTPESTWEAPERTPAQEEEALAELDQEQEAVLTPDLHHDVEDLGPMDDIHLPTQVAPDPSPEPEPEVHSSEPEPIGEGEWTTLDLSSNPPSQ